jgi:hypothetical protein
MCCFNEPERGTFGSLIFRRDTALSSSWGIRVLANRLEIHNSRVVAGSETSPRSFLGKAGRQVPRKPLHRVGDRKTISV